VLAGLRGVLAVIAQFRETDRHFEGLDFVSARGTGGDVGLDGVAEVLAQREEREVVRIKMLHRPPPTASVDV
jgi:hypothetical protein